MFTLDTMRVARDLLVAEIETDRCIVHEPYSLDVIKNLSDEDLLSIGRAEHTNLSNITLMTAKKDDGGDRPVVYIPWLDRLNIWVAFVSNYDAIYHATQVEGTQINYDRPLPPRASDNYLLNDYRESYQEFRARIKSDEQADKIVIHTDICNFAESVHIDDLTRVLSYNGFDEESVAFIGHVLSRGQEKGIQGVPQGYAMMDFILKMIMVPIDNAMRSTYPNVDYYRYCDDIQLSSRDEGELAEAFSFFKAQLADFGFILGEDKTAVCEPGQTGVCHSFDSQAFVDNFKDAIKSARWWEYPNGVSDDDAVRHAFQSFVYPGGSEHPKYLVSHLIREKFKLYDDDVLDVLPALLKKHPSRTYKILKKAAKMDVEGRRPLNRLADMFFGDVSDASMDVQRLEYLKVLKDNDFPISEFDMRVIDNALPEFLVRVPFASGYTADVKSQIEAKAQSKPAPVLRP